MSFVKVSLFDKDAYPTESGAYNTIINTRDGKQVIRVYYFDRNAFDNYDYDKMWIRAEVSEYGYFDHNRSNGEYISAYQKIENVDFSIIPEEMNINIITN